MMSTTPPEFAGQEASGGGQKKGQEVAGQAQEKAQEAASQAKSKAREQLDQRSTQAGEKVSSTAGDLRSISEELRKQGKETPAKLADNAAQRVEKLGGYLKDSDSDRMVRDLEDLGRKQPLAVMLGGVAVGFALSRFLKASSSKRYRSYEAERMRALPPPAPVAVGDGGHSARFEAHA
jgi:hypothetical protein